MNGPSSKYIVITPKLKIISLGEQMEIENKKRWLFVLLQILLGATVFSWLIPVVEAFPQDKFQEKHPDDTILPKNGLQESYFDDVTQSYDEFGKYSLDWWFVLSRSLIKDNHLLLSLT